MRSITITVTVTSTFAITIVIIIIIALGALSEVAPAFNSSIYNPPNRADGTC